jgi:hypothetical protein
MSETIVIPRQTVGHASNTAIQTAKVAPLDQKIAGGLAVERVTDELLTSLRAKVDETFEESRRDETAQYGKCVAYVLGSLAAEDEAIVDHTFLSVAAKQNNGMQPHPPAPIEEREAESAELWGGTDASGREFSIVKFSGHIVLNNGEVPDGVVYSFVSQKPN